MAPATCAGCRFASWSRFGLVLSKAQSRRSGARSKRLRGAPVWKLRCAIAFKAASSENAMPPQDSVRGIRGAQYESVTNDSLRLVRCRYAGCRRN
eukprot:scaffold604_cov384-Prasinococcus_capsulatus_cf.AAC.23